MSVSLKPLAHQIVVVAGADGAVGRTIAHEAAARGARLVLAGRDGATLARLADALGGAGTRILTVETTRADADDARRTAQVAEAAFGGFDTWIAAPLDGESDGATSALAAASPSERRRRFDALAWAAIDGAYEAARHLRRRGGALIAIEPFDRPVRDAGPVGAARGALSGAISGLRRDLAAERAPISVTLVRTHFVAGDPDDAARIARAALHAAEHPRRSLVVTGGTLAGGGMSARVSTGLLETQLHPLAAAALVAAGGLAVAGLAIALRGPVRDGGARDPLTEDRRYDAWRAARPLRRERAATHPRGPRPPVTTH
ncbi:SDR family NAD(P)-dependent oxidoreductase [Salinarimonas ramus]|uniref:SDR family NAD(P)-dependent oxidoreductase n=1 Tax=Salinarimonas ramus TaxID=690164 RepID=A0A917Q7L5_9HYPH|nr:SDR family NAD(P)-dependent oxidoreductase [Salinarimonas ramus]GGK33276.1 hypothetical protein GCM10011322_20010 [Salinarimonas ramus]